MSFIIEKAKRATLRDDLLIFNDIGISESTLVKVEITNPKALQVVLHRIQSTKAPLKKKVECIKKTQQYMQNRMLNILDNEDIIDTESEINGIETSENAIKSFDSRIHTRLHNDLAP